MAYLPQTSFRRGYGAHGYGRQLISKLSRRNQPSVIVPPPDRQGRNYANFVCSAPAAGYFAVAKNLVVRDIHGMIHPASHLSLSLISRGNGRSAVGAAAYIARTKMADNRLGTSFNYSAAPGLLVTGMANWKQSAEALWNAAEEAENRRNARVARELRPALPADLPIDDQRRLVHGFACWLKDKYGVAVHYAIHAPTFHRKSTGRKFWKAVRIEKGENQLDVLFDPTETNLNFHAHILFTTRDVDPESGVFGKKTRDLDHVKKGPQELLKIRNEWERRTNAALERVGSKARIDLRSYEAMAAAGDAPEGLHAQEHLGPLASAKIRCHQEKDGGGIGPVTFGKREQAKERNDDLWRSWLTLRSLERERARLKDSEKIALAQEEERKARAAHERQRIALAKTEREKAAALEEANSIDAPQMSLDPLREAIVWAQKASADAAGPGVAPGAESAPANEFEKEIDLETFESPDLCKAPKVTVRVKQATQRGNLQRVR